MALRRLDEGRQVARGVLLLTEDGARDESAGVVDGSHQGQPWTAALQPVVAAAVDLQQQPRLRHPLAAAAMAPWPAPAEGRQARLAEHPAQRAAGHVEILALGQQLRQVGPVDAAAER